MGCRERSFRCHSKVWGGLGFVEYGALKNDAACKQPNP
jgi:hypothetical protein